MTDWHGMITSLLGFSARLTSLWFAIAPPRYGTLGGEHSSKEDLNSEGATMLKCPFCERQRDTRGTRMQESQIRDEKADG